MQALVMLGACVVGAAPWFPLLSRRHGQRARAVALSIVGLTVVISVIVAIGLPTAYEAQRHFNAAE